MNQEIKTKYGRPSGAEFDWRRYLEVLRKRIWIIVVAFLGVAITGVVHTLNQQHYYFSSAKIAFSSSGPEQVDIYRGNTGRRDYSYLNPLFLKNQIEILKSDRVLRKIAKQLGLVGEDVKETSPLLDQRVRTLRGQIRVKQVETTSIIEVSTTSGNPKQAHRLVKAATEVFVRDNLERNQETHQSNLVWLRKETVDLEDKLEMAQRKLIEFVEKEKLTQFGGQTGLGAQETTEEEQSIKLIGRLKEEKLETELKLSRLLERYLDAHPKVIAARNELERIKKRTFEDEKRLTDLRATNDRRIIESKQKEIQYGILKSKVESYKEIHDAMVRKLKESDIGRSVVQNNASIIEEARLPHYPAGPNKKKRTIYSIIFALLFALALAFIVDYLDNSIRTAEEAENYLDLPVLASIPLVKRIKTEGVGEDLPLLALAEEDEQLREAFRVLRTNLRFSMPARGSHSVLVTSTKKGEGKSTLSANLGLAAAESGKRTIIVDCDLRIPAVHHLFCRENVQGLTNYLTESTPLDELIQQTDTNNLDILTSGPESPKPTALLESDNMLQLLPMLQDIYEMVILDAPPVGMVIDTAVIAGLSEGILLVVEAGDTNRHHILKALEQLNKAKATIHGAVLNKQVLHKKKYLNYYGHYYRDSSKKG